MRSEFKYLVPFFVKKKLEYDLKIFCNTDNNANILGISKINSIYFDSINKYNFNSKENGIYIRSKPRLRFYLDEKEKKIIRSVFEFKNRIWDKGFKNRYVINNFDNKEYSLDYNIKQLPNNFKCKLNEVNYNPILSLGYQRLALTDKFNTDNRFTLDDSIYVSESFNPLKIHSRIKIFNNQDGILEFKFLKMVPQWFKVILKKYNLKQIAISKYSLGIYKLVQTSSINGLK